MNNATHPRQVELPVRIAFTAPGEKFRIKDDGDRDGGWSTIRCANADEARRIIREYPAAAMPCWRHPVAPWNV